MEKTITTGQAKQYFDLCDGLIPSDTPREMLAAMLRDGLIAVDELKAIATAKTQAKLDTTETAADETKPDTKLAWTVIDVATFPPETQRLYADFKELQVAAAKARTAFETAAKAGTKLPKGKVLLLAYRFGKLSAAIADGDAKVAKTDKSAKSLADLLGS